MKNILVPTDFSTCAMHAMDLGLALAEYLDATLHFYTSMDDTQDFPNGGDRPLKSDLAKKDFTESVNLLFNKWQNEAFVRNVRLKCVCTGDPLIDSVKAYVEKNDIDFVVMGSHGRSGISEILIGSNTVKLVRCLHVPVFVVKQPIKNYRFKNVIFASNFLEEEKESFLEFLKFIQNFNPEKIHLLAVNTTGWDMISSINMESNMESFKMLVPTIPCETHLRDDINIEMGIRHFASEVQADLVAISNHNRHPVRRIFAGGNVEALINHCNLPVLSIDYLEKEKLIL